jgi:ClpP class serine protease
VSILAHLYAVPWAVRPDLLAAVLHYVERRDTTPEMLARACHFDPAVAEEARQLRLDRYAVHQRESVLVDRSTGLYRRGRTAILPITGPIIRRGNLMSSMSGGPMASVELLAKDFSRAVEDPSFDAVLLDVDSPGGEAGGISELASIIHAARSEKRVVAYVGDLGASAAYWLASAASEVVVNRTAAVGSIGVVMAVPDPATNADGRVEFVSSASPKKRPDPKSKDGRADIQALVDTYGDLFVEDVAAFRATDRETVLAEFGRGGLLVGADAVEHGMADRLGSFEETLADLESRAERADEPRPTPILPGSHRSRIERGSDSDGDPPPAEEAAPAADRQRSGAMPAAASHSLGGTEMPNSLLEGLRYLVATAEAPASADVAAVAAVAGLDANDRSPSHGHPQAGTPGVTGTSPTGPTAGDETLRRRLVAAEAENARLRFAQIQQRAQAFARAQTDDLRAMPPEVDHLVALYCVLAQDDETHGPLAMGQGRTATRVAYLENLLAARQSRRDLTADVFGDTVAHVLTERSRPRPEDADPDPERLAQLLGHTAVGRQILKEAAFAPSAK